MSSPLPYLIYFVGPCALAILARRVLHVGWKAVGAGLVTFLVAWAAVMVVTQSAASVSAVFAEGTLLYTILVATAAGGFEESARFVAFRTFRGLRKAPTWRTGLAFAVGHSGAESFIVGGSLALTSAVVLYSPESLSPDLLIASREVLATGSASATFAALERLLVGFLIHGAFTLVVVLSVVRSDIRYLALAIAWHAAHDVIAQNLQRLSEHWIAHAAWIGFILLVYSWLIFRLIASIGRSSSQVEDIGAGEVRT